MTQDEMIELAKQSGFERLGHTAEDWVCHLEDIEEFIKLVAEHEREACIAQAITSAEKAIDVAIKLERESCAKEADKRLHDYTMLTSNPPQSGAAWSIASAIRARGDNK